MTQRNSQSGSVFFTLFGAVAITAAITAGVGMYIKGPLTSSVNTHRHQVAKEQSAIAVGVATKAATSQPSSGDCDGDGFVEPMPYLDAGSAAKPAGGGLIPLTMGTQRKDPWRRDYGYCVWDHGPQVDAVGCGGASQKRQRGTNSTSFASIAVISAGPDGVFQTSCNDYVDTTPADGSPDTPLVNTPATSDDIVNEWSYGAAAGSGSGDLWALETLDNTTAEIDKNLSVKDGGGIEQLNFDILNKSLTVGTGGSGKFPSLKTDSLGAYNIPLGWANFSGGYALNCSTRTDNTLWCWGTNTYGQFGNGTTSTTESTPLQSGTETSWAQISLGNLHSCAIKTDGTLWCWGRNDNGGLGNGSAYTVPTEDDPIQVGSGTNWAQVDSGLYHTCGIKNDKTLWCWGQNTFGQLGDNSTTQRTSPVQVGTATNWKSVSSGSRNTCGLKTDGTIWCWGYAAHGMNGDGITSPNSFVPKQVGTATNWKQISSFGFHACAINTSNELWCWGHNSNGQIGNGLTTDRLTPYQVGTAVWKSVGTESEFATCAIRTDGTLWCWGKNLNGQLGDGTTVDKSAPVQVGTDTDWAIVKGGGDHTCAKKTDDTLWCWGKNANGQLGDGTTTQRTTPVQVPGAGGNGTAQLEVMSDANVQGGVMSNGTLVIDPTGLIVHGEQDPKIGALIDGKFCTVVSGKVECSSDAPGGGGDIQDGILPTATSGAPCTKLGELRQGSGGELFVCDDNGGSQIPSGTCADFKAGALTFSPTGTAYFCANM